MTDSQLKVEITTDPANLGYAGKTAQQIVNLINAAKAGVTYAQIVPKPVVFSITTTALFRIAQMATDKQTAWYQIMANIRSLDQGIIPSEPTIQDMLTKAIADGVLTAGERTALEALGIRTGSRAEELWGERTVVTLNDVARIL